MDVVSEAAPLLVAAVPVGDLGGAVQDVRTVPGGTSQPSRLVADASGAPPPSSSRVPTTPGEPPSPPSGSSAPPRASPQTGAAPPPGASPASTARVTCAVCAVARAALIIPGRGCLPEHESDGTDLLFAKAMEAPAAIAARGAQGGVLNSSAAAAASPSSAIPTLTPSSSSPSLYALADAVAALPAADALILHFHSAAAAALDPKSPDAETASALLAVFQEAVVSELISLAVDFGAHAGGMLDGKMSNLRRPPGCGVARVDALVRGTVADGVPAGSRVPCENGSSLLVWRLLCDVAGLSSDAMGAISQPTTSSAEALAMGSADLLRAVVAALPAVATDSALEEIAQLILCALTFTATDGVAYAPRDALTNIDRGLALLHALFAVPIFAKGLGGTVAWERSSIRAHDGRRTRSPRVLPPAVVRALGATEAWAGSLHGALHLSILGALLAPSVVPTATARPFLPQGAAAAPRVTELSPLWHLFAGASEDPWHIDPSKILSATKDVAAEARVHRDKVATFALSFLKAARAEAGPAMFRWADAAWEAQVLSEKNPHSAALAPPRTGTLVNAGLLFVRLTEGLSLGVEPILLTGRPAPPLADASKPDPANPDTFALVSSLPGAQFNGSHASHATGTFHFAAMLLNKGLTRVACGLRDDEEREIQFLFKTLRDAPDATVARERLRQVLGSKHAMNAVRADPVLLAPVLRFTALILEHCARRVDESSGRVGLPLPPFADGHGNIDAPDAHVVVTLQLLKCIAKTESLYRVPLQWRILNTAFSETRALVAAPKGVAAVSASPSAADALPAPPPSLARILFNGLLTMIGSAPLGPARVHAGPRDDSLRDTAVDAFYGLFVPPFARARALPTDNPEPLSSLDATAWGAQFEALAGGVPGGLPVTVLRGLLSVFVAVEKQPTHVNDDFNRQCTRERILSILALVWSRRGPWEGALAAALDEPFAIALCSHMADAVNEALGALRRVHEVEEEARANLSHGLTAAASKDRDARERSARTEAETWVATLAQVLLLLSDFSRDGAVAHGLLSVSAVAREQLAVTLLSTFLRLAGTETASLVVRDRAALGFAPADLLRSVVGVHLGLSRADARLWPAALRAHKVAGAADQFSSAVTRAVRVLGLNAADAADLRKLDDDSRQTDEDQDAADAAVECMDDDLIDPIKAALLLDGVRMCPGGGNWAGREFGPTFTRAHMDELIAMGATCPITKGPIVAAQIVEDRETQERAREYLDEFRAKKASLAPL